MAVRLRIGGKYDLNEFEIVFRHELRLAQEAQLEILKEYVIEELERILNHLRQHSANRGKGFYAVRYNDVFDEADITVDLSWGPSSGPGWNIRVENKVFNILSVGSPARSSSKPMTFPKYNAPIVTSPAPARVTDTSELELGNKAARIRGWHVVPPGVEIKAIKPRKFYQYALKRALKRFNKDYADRDFKIAGAPVREINTLVKGEVRKK